MIELKVEDECGEIAFSGRARSINGVHVDDLVTALVVAQGYIRYGESQDEPEPNSVTGLRRVLSALAPEAQAYLDETAHLSNDELLGRLRDEREAAREAPGQGVE